MGMVCDDVLGIRAIDDEMSQNAVTVNK